MIKDYIKKIISYVMVVVMITATFIGAGLFNNSTSVEAASLKLNKKKITLNVGDEFKLKVNGLASDQKVTFKSSKPKVCKVNNNGNLTPKKKGKAVITAVAGGKKLKCKVTVRICFTISKKTKLLDVGKNKYSSYSSAFVNKYTYDWYLFRSHLEKLENDGGGTIIVKKGTYNIPSALCIPSNVNIIFNKGAKINKTDNTHTNKFAASKTLFELVPAAKFKTKGWAKKYNGVKNVKLIGKGNNVINMNYYYQGVAVTIFHSKNICVSGITFKNINESHSIELDAGKNIEISNCKFSGQKGSNYLREAINLDIPDGTVKLWAANDQTNNNGVVIKDCDFKDLYVGVGSHFYSYKKSTKDQIYHNDILVENCTFKNMKKFGVQALNWANSTIKGCTFDGIGNSKNAGQGVAGRGSQKLDVIENTFKDCKGTDKEKGFGIKVVDYQIKKLPRTYPKFINDDPEKEEEYFEKNNTFAGCDENVECKIIIKKD